MLDSYSMSCLLFWLLMVDSIRGLIIATLGSTLDSQLSWSFGKCPLARWSHQVALFPLSTHPPHLPTHPSTQPPWFEICRRSQVSLKVRHLWEFIPRDIFFSQGWDLYANSRQIIWPSVFITIINTLLIFFFCSMNRATLRAFSSSSSSSFCSSSCPFVRCCRSGWTDSCPPRSLLRSTWLLSC